jgi:transcriptional regulator with XRE-family HTH domain
LEQNLGNRIKELRTVRGMKQTELAEKAGISQGTLSAVERSEKSPTAETLHSIASALGILVSDLLEEKFCPVCGFEYAYDEGLNSEAHQRAHSKAQTIIDRYGFFWPYRVQKIEITTARAIIADPNAPEIAKHDAAISILQALFSRSVAAYQYADHPDFRAYAAMMLGNDDYRAEIPPEVCAQLEAEFGKRKGIQHGAYYQRSRKVDDQRIARIISALPNLAPQYLDIIYFICSAYAVNGMGETGAEGEKTDGE